MAPAISHETEGKEAQNIIAQVEGSGMAETLMLTEASSSFPLKTFKVIS